MSAIEYGFIFFRYVFGNTNKLKHKNSALSDKLKEPKKPKQSLMLKKYFTNYVFIYRSRLNIRVSNVNNRFGVRQESKGKE